MSRTLRWPLQILFLEPSTLSKVEFTSGSRFPGIEYMNATCKKSPGYTTESSRCGCKDMILFIPVLLVTLHLARRHSPLILYS